MLTVIKDSLKSLSNKYDNWDELIVETLEKEGENGEGINALEEFTSILKRIIKMIKSEDLCIADVETLFESYGCKEYALRYINATLRTYHSFDSLRKLEIEDIYKAKRCVDQIWESYILRYNPYFSNPEGALLNDDEYRCVAKEIDRITDLCIEHNFHILAIIKQFQDKSGLSNELCRYISQKIDEDFEKLKLNYIIFNLSEN